MRAVLFVLIKRPLAWAVNTQNMDYVKMCGWRKAVKQEKHRKEIVAGNLAEYAISGEPLPSSRSSFFVVPDIIPIAEFKTVTDRLGDDDRTWYEVRASFARPPGRN